MIPQTSVPHLRHVNKKDQTINHRGTETQRKSTAGKPGMAFAFSAFLCASVSLWLMVLDFRSLQWNFPG
ncbi:MAG: hypothetical protein LBI62_04315 [Candidatus Accumulibacter sp.]|jgi:hypothetical protein|nr:hypothetical protein [Accumulibacter sp.]